ncbi:cupin domain-containing protein [Candidatus Spongiihabitans sp.]|uniref:cupin domain-containing protein n=1 Tax=Candidatus Spongiihabitans sp. TaxID=3101308 RepID=UPI003C79FD50
MPKAVPISLDNAFKALSFRGNRTPESNDIDDAFCVLSDYRDGGIFLAYYAGNSEWERHTEGDELVMVLEGETSLFVLGKNGERKSILKQGEIFVVPQGMWHRFESPTAVKIMTITPQPTDHSIETPVLSG